MGAIASAARPQYGGTLRVETEAVVRTIDPSAPAADPAEAAARGRVSRLVFEPLAAVDGGGLRPALATSWDEDARTGRWRFHLRSGVVLHDGAMLEAWQAAASLRVSEPAWKVSVDADTVLIDPDVPTPDLPWAIADERHAIVVRGGGGSLLGTGPFRLDRTDNGRVVLRAHDAYWRARPFADAVQIDTGRAFDAQLTDLEAGRADIVNLRATDARRAARRGLRLDASNPLELVALIVEQRRASDAMLPWRRALAATLNRDAICDVVLQGHAVPARSVLPAWLSGYAPVVAMPPGATLTRAAVAALPLDMREITIRVEPGDAVLQAIGERIAVDAREAGFSVNLQAPVGLAPRADARLVRVRLAPTAPDRALVSAASRLTVRGWPPLVALDSLALKDTWLAEQALLAQAIVMPVVHVPELYALGERVGFSAQPAANPTGGWNLAELWVRGKP